MAEEACHPRTFVRNPYENLNEHKKYQKKLDKILIELRFLQTKSNAKN